MGTLDEQGDAMAEEMAALGRLRLPEEESNKKLQEIINRY